MAAKNRSNQPRITGGAKNSQYHYAVEVAGQPAKTTKEKKTKMYADNVAKAFESRFPSSSERTAVSKKEVLNNAKKNMTQAQKDKVASQSRRSNQPRAGKMIEEDQPAKYRKAVEITKKKATTVGEKVTKRQAEASARSYEKRFPTLSIRKEKTSTSSTKRKLGPRVTAKKTGKK